MPHNPALRDLQSRFPLPAGWRLSEVFTEDCVVGGLRLQLVGLSAEGPEGAAVSGGAAEWAAVPWARAYFELIERIIVWSCRSDLLPPAEGNSFRPALSNGIALHESKALAAERARWELIERDRVLRSWFGQTRPELRPEPLAIESALSSLYRLRVFSFRDVQERGSNSPVEVAGVFAFPLESGLPFAYGFGAAEDFTSATAHAERELCQRMGFFWGQTLEPEITESPGTPEYHQEIFLRPEGMERVRAWLDGQQQPGCMPPRLNEHLPEVFRYTVLGQGLLCPGLVVVRAESEQRIPLLFGTGAYSEWIPGLDPRREIHPVA